jgi:hypothetical protein
MTLRAHHGFCPHSSHRQHAKTESPGLAARARGNCLQPSESTSKAPDSAIRGDAEVLVEGCLGCLVTPDWLQVPQGMCEEGLIPLMDFAITGGLGVYGSIHPHGCTIHHVHKSRRGCGKHTRCFLLEDQ